MTDDDMIILTMLIADEVEDIVKAKPTSSEQGLRSRLGKIKERVQSAKDKASEDSAADTKVEWF